MTGVWVLGGAQSDFARNLTREGLDIADLTGEVVDATLAAAGVDAAAVEVVHVGNAFGQLFTGQGHLGAMPATVRPDLWGVPAARHEAACASGSIAVLAAMADLRAGNYDVRAGRSASSWRRTVPGDEAARHLGAAAWVGHEAEGARFMWPHMFDRIAEEYADRYGLDDAHLRAIAALNLANAKRNPNAQTRAWDVPDLTGPLPDEVNPVVEGRIRRYDCSQVTDGGGGCRAGLRRVPAPPPRARRPAARPDRRLGPPHRRAVAGAEARRATRTRTYLLPHVRDAVLDAFGRARVGLDGVDALETHDCFTPSEYLAIDHFGLTGPGESWKAIENGDIAPGGRLPVNPCGGLIGGGHPVGATGVRMLLDAARQVTDQAGEYQVDGARTAATLNIGGSTATTVSFVVTAP